MSSNRMRTLVLLVVALPVAASFAISTGCTRAPASGTVAGELPYWVKVVPSVRNGRIPFVGGVSFAVDAETGIEAATSDAMSQIELAARQRFIDLFNAAVQESGAETTPMERLDYKTRVQDAYAEAVAQGAVRDTVYYQPCGAGPGGTGSVDPAAGGPVCRVFILLSVAEGDWDVKLGEVLAVEKRRQAEEGAENLVGFTEYLMRQVMERNPEGRRERGK